MLLSPEFEALSEGSEVSGDESVNKMDVQDGHRKESSLTDAGQSSTAAGFASMFKFLKKVCAQ